MPSLDRKRLWAPWRSTFIKGRRQRACFICAARRSSADRKHHVVARGKQVFAILNRFPYNNGHLMIAPYRHVGRFESLTPGEWAESLRLCQRLLARLNRVIRPQGYNIGLNLGLAAGAGVPGHLHLHMVPRWTGDMNFMPVLGNAKVMSQSLDEMFTALASPRKRRSR